jgi:tRNA modification GTPase
MDTIVAIATSTGRSAIGVVRLSGPECRAILQSLVQDPSFNPEPRKLFLKEILRTSGETLDSALLSYFEEPHSFTGEDMLEINCHGSPLILRSLLDLTQSLGARLAGPGEFTLRACRHGKLNLAQAEAIRDLINAQTEAASSQALRQLKGELSLALQPVKQLLIDVIVRLESALEFVEDDLPQVESASLENKLAQAEVEIRKLTETFDTGRALRDGINVAIVGPPNAGKSSVFNRLVGRDRAIVTEHAGTTRDTISESITLGGIPVTLTDTAGMRATDGSIEQLGVERSYRAAADADLLIVMIDGSKELTSEDEAILADAATARHIVALNKSDLDQHCASSQKLSSAKVVHVSAVTGAGLDKLTAAILEPFGNVDSEAAGLLITDSRHFDLLSRTETSLKSSRELLQQGASEEIVLVGLHNALGFLGQITGETTTDDILGEIFSTFCIGK